MSRPRRQHYLFAHRVLPDLALSSPERFLSFLSAEGIGFLEDVWNKCGEFAEGEALVPSEGLDYSIRQLNDNTLVACISLPPPLNVPEAYFVAIVHRKEPPIASEAKPGCTRFFTLEHGMTLDGGARTVLCEWGAEGSHLNYGEGPQAQREYFLSAVMRMLEN